MSEQFHRADNPSSPDTGSRVDAQPVPHSGNLHEGLREQPVRQFDNTSLHQAYEAGHLVTPTSPSPLIDQEHKPEQKKSRKGLLIGLGAGAAGLAIAAGAVFGINALNQAPQSEPIPTAPAEEEPTPEPESTAFEAEPVTTAAFEIPGSLSPEEAGAALVDRLSSWTMSGANEETIRGYADAGGLSSYPTDVSHGHVATIADALFVPSWRSDETLSQYVEFERGSNALVLEAWLVTESGANLQDREPYVRWVDVDAVSVVSATEETATLIVDATERDTSENNRGEIFLQGRFDNPNPIRGDITLQRVDDTWKIAAIAWSSRDE